MIDLAMMDRLLRALRADARLVLLGDADQLPSIEAGAVFRDLCAAVPARRLTQNLRVGRDPSARRIIGTAQAVNAGVLAASLRRSGGDPGVGRRRHLRRGRAPGRAVVRRRRRLARSLVVGAHTPETEAAVTPTASRTRTDVEGGFVDADDQARLRALFAYHAAVAHPVRHPRARDSRRARNAINAQLSDRAPGTRRTRRRLAPAPAISSRARPSSFERTTTTAASSTAIRGVVRPRPAATARGVRLERRLPARGVVRGVRLSTRSAISRPAFAMTVHKAQGSEFDDVTLVLPETDLPLLTRELVYTAVTRARRSVLIVGERGLLERAVARTVQRFSGVAERLRMR